MLQSKKKHYDINQLPSDWYIILPLSMSRLSSGKWQSAEECFEVIQFFEKKITKVGIDFIFLYTNWLYYNNEESALSVRKKTNTSMIAHKNKILKLVLKSKKYIPQAMHFIPWDYIILNSIEYDEFYSKLVHKKDTDPFFLSCLEKDLWIRDRSEANIKFLIEEIVVTHLIREKLIDFPKTLIKNDSFRLMCYPWNPLLSDIYQRNNDFLPKKSHNNYAWTQYNLSEKVLLDFSLYSFLE